jgi:signal transduction histidine kinase
MTTSVAFRTQARTIDHLGREQIADVPTAISELWKNAYDAYALKAELHVYDSDRMQAALFDTGHGMSRRDFEDKWLVVGTASKATDDEIPIELRQGLPLRPKQGQKGIGRLSLAALGTTVLVVSRMSGEKFVSALIDWRFFENPYVILEDIRIPVVDFDRRDELPRLIAGMREELLRNLGGFSTTEDNRLEVERQARLKTAWSEYSELEAKRLVEAAIGTASQTTEQHIRRLLEDQTVPNLDPLDDWDVWSGEWKCGTAMIVAECNPVFEAWLSTDKQEIQESIRKSFKRTLEGFSNPYFQGRASGNYTEALSKNYDIGVFVHTRGSVTKVIGDLFEVNFDFIKSLEHFFQGEFDSYGIFEGRVKAFGKDEGVYKFSPPSPPPMGLAGKVGRFSVAIGAFEGEKKSTTHADAVYAKILDIAEDRSGLNIYRDGLRVMPYGRPENDFFKIELRRTNNAGREFWSARRMFGAISISRSENPNLKDKAGREGLIDNAASRAIQVLVIELLKDLARRFYGGDADLRTSRLDEIQAENNAAAAKAEKARKHTVANFRKELRAKAPILNESSVLLRAVSFRFKDLVVSRNPEDIFSIGAEIERLVDLKEQLRLPPKPKRLSRIEDEYRRYRDDYSIFSQQVEDVRRDWRETCEKLVAVPPRMTAESHLQRNQQALSKRVSIWRDTAISRLKSESERVLGRASDDHKSYYAQAAPVLEGVENVTIPLGSALRQMDAIRDDLINSMGDFYEPYIRALESLAEGVDLDVALTYSEARRDTLEDQVQKIQALAQIGISVEILGHELHALNRRLDTSLAALPADVRASKEFQTADEARRELFERLRFLSRMQITEGDLRRRITGLEIFEYVQTFFSTVLKEENITLEATTEFERVTIEDYPSRIYPVFINLVNNSVYWVARAEQKLIRLDVSAGGLLVSDTGPGVDPDDQEFLFGLFFTKRLRGRGVGLYLCKQTLAAGGHTIEYVSIDAGKALPGANFKIVLRDGLNG